MKRLICFALAAALLLSTGVPALADGPAPISTEVEYLDNGYYIVTEIYAVQTRAQQLTSGTKVQSLYSANGDLAITFEVHGTFKYSGTTCIATLASYDYEIHAAGWYLVSASAWCEDNKAIANGEFKHPLLGTVDTTVTLSCSPTGVLS